MQVALFAVEPAGTAPENLRLPRSRSTNDNNDHGDVPLRELKAIRETEKVYSAHITKDFLVLFLPLPGDRAQKDSTRRAFETRILHLVLVLRRMFPSPFFGCSDVTIPVRFVNLCDLGHQGIV